MAELLAELWDDIPTVRCGVLDSCENCESAKTPGPSDGVPVVVREGGTFTWDGDTEPAFPLVFPFDLSEDLGGEG